jgi:Fe-S cluster biogenesis protein NfuA/nitrite reductase/ring-hydroxylating ferredoxin subunit
MALAADTPACAELVAEIEHGLEALETIPDDRARELATGLVQAIVELYGTGLERIVEAVAAHDRDGALAERLADDELVAHLLLMHGLHPVALGDRIGAALAEVRPYLESHGGDVELLGVEGSTLRVRLQGSCSGCPSSTMTLKLAIENAVHKHAPEIESVLAESPPETPGLLQIELSPTVREPEGVWVMAGGLPELARGEPVLRRVSGAPIMFAAVGASTYAYRDGCPACAGSLEGAQLDGVALACPGCGNRYDMIRAGRCLDSPRLHLEPVPLLVGPDGLVKVALRAAA